MPPKTNFTQMELPVRGMFPDAAPESLERGYAQSLTNWLIRPGKLVPRGPVNHLESVATPITATGRLFGGRGWVFGDKIAFTAHESSSAAKIRQYWTATYRRASALGDLAENVGYGSIVVPSIWVYDVSTDTLTSVTHTNAALALECNPGLRGVSHLSKVWGPAYKGNGGWTSIVAGAHSDRHLVSWDGGTTAAAWSHFNYAGTGPSTPMDAASHYQRLFVLDISNAFGWNDLKFTNPGEDPALTASWLSSAGITNSIGVGPDDPNDPGVALATLSGDLLIFKRRSTWVLKGYSTDTFAVKQVTSELGCLDPRSVVETDTAVYWMSQRGFVSWDGAQISYLSDPVNQSQLLPAAVDRVGDAGDDGGFVEAALLQGECILLSVGTHRSTNGTVVDARDRQYIYDLRRGTWTHFTGLLPTAATSPHSIVKTATRLVGLGCSDIHDMQYVTQPELAVAAGKSLLVDDQAVDARYDPSWTSRAARLAMPFLRAQLLKSQIETLITYTGTQFQPFTLTPYHAESDTAMTVSAPALPTSGDRQRHVGDYFDEVEDVYFTVAADADFTIANTQFQAIELRSLGIEWSGTNRQV